MSSEHTAPGPAERPVPADEDVCPRRTVIPVAGAERAVIGHRFMLPVVREIKPARADDRRPAA